MSHYATIQQSEKKVLMPLEPSLHELTILAMSRCNDTRTTLATKQNGRNKLLTGYLYSIIGEVAAGLRFFRLSDLCNRCWTADKLSIGYQLVIVVSSID